MKGKESCSYQWARDMNNCLIEREILIMSILFNSIASIYANGKKCWTDNEWKHDNILTIYPEKIFMLQNITFHIWYQWQKIYEFNLMSIHFCNHFIFFSPWELHISHEYIITISEKNWCILWAEIDTHISTVM